MPPRTPSYDDVRALLHLLNRRKWHLAGVTALVCLLAGLVLAQLTPQYRATALVMLDIRKEKVTNTPDVVSALTLDIPIVETEIEVLRSTSLLGRVVDKLRLDQDPEYGAQPVSVLGLVLGKARAIYERWLGFNADTGHVAQTIDHSPRARAIESLESKIRVGVRGRSYVITVSLDSAVPAKAQQIVKTITDFYVVDQLQAKLDANTRATEFFNDRLEDLKRKVEAAERAVAAYREKSGLTIGKDSTVVSQSLSELNTQLIQARAYRADRESRLVALQQAAHNPATLGAVTEVMVSPTISSLRAQEAEVGRRIAELVKRYGDSYPSVVQARSEQKQIEAFIATEVAKIIASVKGDAEAARAKEAKLQEQVSRLEEQAGGAGRKEVELRELQREAQATRDIYEDFLKRFKELREQRHIQEPDARILSPSSVSTGPVSPRYGLTMILAALVGLGIGVVAIGVLERLDDGFRSGDQIERLTGRPLVGMIPRLARRKLGQLMPARFAIENPTSAYAEALRSAFTAITLGSLDNPPRVILVTSSLPGEGKSTFACSLAGLMARSNPAKRIVIIDCDLRRASVVSSLGVSETNGTIDEYLAGSKTLDQTLGREESSRLYYVPAKRNTPNSAEILNSNIMRTFVEGLATQFDLVILDTPPLITVSDALVTAQLADYVVFVVRWEQTSRELAVNALKQMRDLRKHVGIVLTQVDVRRHLQYGYGDHGSCNSKYRDYYTN
ncbi:Wzz/FepE/Etk N-terminal domain-containing protein [Enhydrobacter sp.]|uniref:GumC family protein n=1 Tax=Enhydrobacter sp. TaxID=1894999 RepID=UPI00261CA285|nr:Wzz/FepE/Etk N-terminal domain-containing protein [Enhydrobacter sp.]WIM13741.1 MAG: Tyrosine-protein kinase [Enhydrobacter sp.]